jgi:HPt (histidine-containing phosphotransfer) domain-containing protein
LLIIALSASALVEEMDLCFSSGMKDFLSKPIEKKALDKILKKWLAKYCVAANENEIEKENSHTSVSIYENIAGLNISKGLTYSGGELAFYEKTVGMVIRSVPETVKRLDEYFAAENWSAYLVDVHGAASSLANIGNDELSQQAKKLEAAAREKNEIFIRENHDVFKTQILKFIAALEEANSKNKKTDELAPGDFSKLKIILPQVISFLDNFECDLAAEQLGEILNFNYNETVNKNLTALVQAIDEMDCDAAIEICKNILGG